MNLKSNPLNEKQLLALNALVKDITADQLIWLNGFLEGRFAALNKCATVIPDMESEPVLKANLTILYGTETGNAKALADILAEKALFKNISATVLSMYDYNYKKLNEEENLAIIVSTHGEGDPPDMAEDFHKYITGERVPKLENLTYSVLALGDKSYKYFCKAGEDIYSAFKRLGAFNIVPIVSCDVDYEMKAEVWMNNFLMNLLPAGPVAKIEPKLPKTSTSKHSKKNPFLATVLKKVKISGLESDKEVYHLELALENSGLIYEPGDSVGIFTKNPDSLVAQIIQKTGFNPEQKVDIGDEEFSIVDALTYHLEITVLTFDILQKYYEKTKNREIVKLLNDDKVLNEYLFGHDLLDLLEDFPFQWFPNKLLEILRPLPPRLYSISSSQESVGDQVHATVSVVRYENEGRKRQGACSSYLADDINLDDQIPIYIDKNPSFRLPSNGSKIIMVGTGTGIAPYRAFMQQRESEGIKGNSWLFFGDRTFKADFLFQEEWQKLLKSEHLEKLDLAFSRDQNEKIYVQHKLKENQNEIFDWIENGAHFYLCGEMKHMAEDVNKTLLEIIQNEGGISEEQAEKYLKKLKREKRFQKDVY